MNSDMVERLIRTGLQVTGAVVGTWGFMSEAQWTAISGALLTLATTGWTIYAAGKAPK